MFVARLLINALALLAVFFLIWHVQGDNVIVEALVMAVVLALINAFIRPVVILLTLPVTFLTLGLFAVVVNAILFYVAALIVHIHVGFLQAALGWLAFVIISGALNQVALAE